MRRDRAATAFVLLCWNRYKRVPKLLRSVSGEVLAAWLEHIKSHQQGQEAVSKQKRAYKFRFYPTDGQRINLAQTFGCVRFVYNWGLHTRKTAYKERGEKLSYNELAARLPDLKKHNPWLGEVSSVPIQQSLRHLDRA